MYTPRSRIAGFERFARAYNAKVDPSPMQENSSRSDPLGP